MTMTEPLTLFDPDVYGPGTPPRNRTDKPVLPTEPHQNPWLWIRDRRGVRPYAHLPKALLGTGAVLTCCDQVGQPMTADGETEMIRCPECDVNAQMAQLQIL